MIKYLAILLAILQAGASPLLSGQKEDLLRNATNGCSFSKETIFFTNVQRNNIEKLAGTRVRRNYIAQYRGMCAGKPLFGYFVSDKVRTLPQTLLIILDQAGAVHTVQVVRFREPPEYKGPDRWYRAFTGKSLSQDLIPGRDIQALTGATLTARTTTALVREVMAIHSSTVRQ